MSRLVVIGLVVSVLTIAVLIYLIRSRRLQERHAILWIAGTIVIVILGASKSALDWVSRGVGIDYEPSTLFLVVVAFLGLAILDAVVTISTLMARVRTLAQRLAMVEERLSEVENSTDTSLSEPSPQGVTRQA